MMSSLLDGMVPKVLRLYIKLTNPLLKCTNEGYMQYNILLIAIYKAYILIRHNYT